MWGQSWRLFRLYIYNGRVTCHCGNFRVFENKNILHTKKGELYRKAALQPVESHTESREATPSIDYGLRGIRPRSGT